MKKIAIHLLIFVVYVILFELNLLISVFFDLSLFDNKRNYYVLKNNNKLN
jgi:hypothetical protein